MRELKRVFSVKLISLLVLLMAITALSQLLSNPYSPSFKSKYQNDIAYYSKMDIDAALSEIDEIEADIDYENLDATDDFFSSQQSRSVVRSQLEHLRDYPQYLDSIHQNAVGMRGLAIFNSNGNNSFNLSNIEKTDNDYPTKNDISIALCNTLSIEYYLNDNISSLCLLVLVIAVIMSFVSERKNALSQLVYGTPNGRKLLALKRLIILLFACITGTLLIKGTSLLVNTCLYGTPDLAASVQSSALFRDFTYLITFRQYLVLDITARIIGLFTVALLIWSIITAIHHLQTAIICAGVFLTFEYTAFSLIPDSFSLVIFRFLNIFAFIDNQKIMLKYLNVNVFNQAIRGSYISLILMVVLVTGCSLFIIMFSEKSKPIAKKNVFVRLYEKLLPIISRLSSRHGLTGYELKKMLWYQKGIIVVAAVLVWCFCFLDTPPADREMYNPLLSAYQTEFQGEVTETTIADIDSRILETNTWQDSEIKEIQLASLKALKEEAVSMLDNGLWIVNPIPFAMIGNKGNYYYQVILNIFYLLPIALLLSGVFSYEKQCRTESLLLTTKNGRGRLARFKIAVSLFVILFIWALISTRAIYLICETVNDTQWLTVPIKSVEYFQDYVYNCPAYVWVVTVFFKRLLKMLIVGVMCIVISKWTKTVNKSIVFCSLFSLLISTIIIL